MSDMFNFNNKKYLFVVKVNVYINEINKIINYFFTYFFHM